MVIIGFVVWIIIGLAAGFATFAFYRGPTTTQLMSLTLAAFGAFIGGMLGMSPYIHHAPMPLRFGGVLGAALGAVFFSVTYHFIAKKAI